MMDIAIPQNTGYPAKSVEQCLCPEGYEGLSCESCARGYYRDQYDLQGPVGTCKPCDCNGNELGCSLNSAGDLVCQCKDGFDGDQCQNSQSKFCNNIKSDLHDYCFFADENPISVTVTEPKIKIVQVGESVTLRCNVQTSGLTDVVVTWNKENGVLPFNRVRSDTNGILIITDVRSEDAGNYVCVAENSFFIATDTASLSVDGGTNVPEPPRIVDIQPSRTIEVIQGDRVQLYCNATGRQILVSWLRNGQAISRSPTLYLDNVSRQEEGEYVCRVENQGGYYELSAYIYVVVEARPEEQPTVGPTGNYPSFRIEPETLTISQGQAVQLTCISNNPRIRIQWSKTQGRLPYNAQIEGSVLTLYETTVEDSGVFECTGFDSDSGQTLTAQAQVSIVQDEYKEPPTARIEPKRLDVAQGEQGSFRCVTEGNYNLLITSTNDNVSLRS